MARFRGIVAGQAGEASRLGSPRSGLVARCDGWNAGVHVIADALATDPTKDVFAVYATGGSNHAARNVCLGTVRETKDGRVLRLDDCIIAALGLTDDTFEINLDEIDL